MKAVLNEPSATVAVFADPAPYCLPPVDLFRWKILLLPKGAATADGSDAAVCIRAVDVPPVPAEKSSSWRDLWTATPISWADKPFDTRHLP